jgi:carboxyl-terminal processing protease
MKRSKYLLFIPVLLLGFFLGALTPELRALPEKIYHSLDLFSKVLFIVEKDYVEEVDGENLVYGAIKGMLGTLDPYSIFLTPDIYKELKVDTLGRFGGVGIEITLHNGVLTVVSPIEDTPAARAGIQPGDAILKINGVLTKGMNLGDAVRRMRGSKKSKLVLTLYREGVAKPFDVSLTREVIKIKSVKPELLDNKIAYVRITSFQEKTSEELENALSDYEKRSKGLKGIILDLRNNPGGLLDQAVLVSNLFLKSGTIVSTRGRHGETEVKTASAEGTHFDAPIVILVNRGSASASEIVSAALQDNKRAKILGTRSFGKGSVQTVIDLGDDTGLKLTIAKYYSPLGKVIDGKGVTPDFIVKALPTTETQPSNQAKVDNQKQAAIQYMLTGNPPPAPPKGNKKKTDAQGGEEDTDSSEDQ